MSRHRAAPPKRGLTRTWPAVQYSLALACLVAIGALIGIIVTSLLPEAESSPVLVLHPGKTGEIRVSGNASSSPFPWRVSEAVIVAALGTVIALSAFVLTLLQARAWGNPSRRFMSWASSIVVVMVMGVLAFLFHQLGSAEASRVSMFTVVVWAFALPAGTLLVIILRVAISSRHLEKDRSARND